MLVTQLKLLTYLRRVANFVGVLVISSLIDTECIRCDIWYIIWRMWRDVVGALEYVTVVDWWYIVWWGRGPRVVGVQRGDYFAGMWHLIDSKSSSWFLIATILTPCIKYNIRLFRYVLSYCSIYSRLLTEGVKNVMLAMRSGVK